MYIVVILVPSWGWPFNKLVLGYASVQDHLQKGIQVQEAITQLICTVMMATNYYAIGGHSSERKAVGMVFSVDTKYQF